MRVELVDNPSVEPRECSDRWCNLSEQAKNRLDALAWSAAVTMVRKEPFTTHDRQSFIDSVVWIGVNPNITPYFSKSTQTKRERAAWIAGQVWDLRNA